MFKRLVSHGRQTGWAARNRMNGTMGFRLKRLSFPQRLTHKKVKLK